MDFNSFIVEVLKKDEQGIINILDSSRFYDFKIEEESRKKLTYSCWDKELGERRNFSIYRSIVF